MSLTKRQAERIQRFFHQKQEEARTWIQEVIEEEIGENLNETLKDGVVLCKLIQKVSPGSVPKEPVKAKTPWKMAETVDMFLNACKEYGVSTTFEAKDLVTNNNLFPVIRTIHDLADLAQQKGFAIIMKRDPASGSLTEITPSLLNKSSIRTVRRETRSPLPAFPSQDKTDDSPKAVRKKIETFSASNSSLTAPLPASEKKVTIRSPKNINLQQTKNSLANELAQTLEKKLEQSESERSEPEKEKLIQQKNGTQNDTEKKVNEEKNLKSDNEQSISETEKKEKKDKKKKKRNDESSVSGSEPSEKKEKQKTLKKEKKSKKETNTDTPSELEASEKDKSTKKEKKHKKQKKEKKEKKSETEISQSNSLNDFASQVEIKDKELEQPSANGSADSVVINDQTQSNGVEAKEEKKEELRGSNESNTSVVSLNASESKDAPNRIRTFSSTSLDVSSSTEIEDESEETKAKMQRFRILIINEIIKTELDYVNDVSVMIKKFLHPIREKGLLEHQMLNGIFSNIEMLHNVNVEMLKAFEERTNGVPPENWVVGDIFVKMGDYLRMYTGYCNNQGHAYSTMQQSIQSNANFASWLEEAHRDTELKGLYLRDFLVKPVQRICKYPLLIKELLKQTPKSHVDYDHLKLAFKKVQDITAHVNEAKRHDENVAKMVEIQHAIAGCENLLEPTRRYVRQGLVDYIRDQRSTTQVHFFLFNDLILVAKSTGGIFLKKESLTLKAKISLNWALISEMPDTKENKNAFQISTVPKSRYDKPEKYVFVTKTKEERDSWVDEISKLLDEITKKTPQERRKSETKEPLLTFSTIAAARRSSSTPRASVDGESKRGSARSEFQDYVSSAFEAFYGGTSTSASSGTGSLRMGSLAANFKARKSIETDSVSNSSGGEDKMRRWAKLNQAHKSNTLKLLEEEKKKRITLEQFNDVKTNELDTLKDDVNKYKEEAAKERAAREKIQIELDQLKAKVGNGMIEPPRSIEPTDDESEPTKENLSQDETTSLKGTVTPQTPTKATVRFKEEPDRSSIEIKDKTDKKPQKARTVGFVSSFKRKEIPKEIKPPSDMTTQGSSDAPLRSWNKRIITGMQEAEKQVIVERKARKELEEWKDEAELKIKELEEMLQKETALRLKLEEKCKSLEQSQVKQ